MVRRFLFPGGGGQNELQLWPVASRANEMCNYCNKQPGHYKNECPVKARSPALKGTHLSGGKEVLGLKAYANNAWGNGLPAGTKGGLSSGGGPSPHVVVDVALNEDYNRTHVYIEHLPLSISESSLLCLFLPFGQITHAKIFRNQSTGLGKGNGFVRYVKAADASMAVSVMDGYRLDDKVLEVKLKSSQADASKAVSVMDGFKVFDKVPEVKLKSSLQASMPVDGYGLDDTVPEVKLKKSLQAVANDSLLASISQQKLQEELAVVSALHPHAGMPPSRAGQVSPPSSALQGIGPLPISSGLEAHVDTSRFLPPNHIVQSRSKPSPSSAAQAGVSGLHLHYDYSPSQIQSFFSSATQCGVTGSHLPVMTIGCLKCSQFPAMQQRLVLVYFIILAYSLKGSLFTIVH